MLFSRCARAAFAACIAVGSITTAQARATDLCFGPTVSTYDCYTTGCTRTNNATVFTCPQAGTKTIPQLGQAGWAVVRLSSQAVSVDSTTGNAMTTDRLIIRRVDRVFANGFDPL